MTENSQSLTVAQVMRTDVPTAAPGDAVGTVAAAMVSSGSAGIVVVDNGELRGIITEADLIAREAEITMPTATNYFDATIDVDAGTPFSEDIRRVTAATAADLMTHPVYTIRSSATMQQVATLMVDHQINSVPVIDDNNALVGIVNRAELVKVIARMENAG